jgi:hypothetical protein
MSEDPRRIPFSAKVEPSIVTDWARLVPVKSNTQQSIISPFDNPLTALDPFPESGPSRQPLPPRSNNENNEEEKPVFAPAELQDLAALLENPIPDRKTADLNTLDSAMEYMVSHGRTDITDEEYRRVRNKV